MRRIVIWAMSTVTVLVLLFSYRTSTSNTAATVVTAGNRTGTGSAGSGGASGSVGGSPGSAGTGGTTTSGTTVPGTVVPTRFGNVQVQIIVANGRITAASVLQVPNRDRKDVQINGRAVPILNQETLDAQSSDIDMVSGATVTSQAYVQSLQSAIDRAHL